MEVICACVCVSVCTRVTKMFDNIEKSGFPSCSERQPMWPVLTEFLGWDAFLDKKPAESLENGL